MRHRESKPFIPKLQQSQELHPDFSGPDLLTPGPSCPCITAWTFIALFIFFRDIGYLMTFHMVPYEPGHFLFSSPSMKHCHIAINIQLRRPVSKSTLGITVASLLLGSFFIQQAFPPCLGLIGCPV